MTRTLTIIIASASLLTGCSNMREFRPTMASDTPLVGIEGQIFQMEMASAFEEVTSDAAKELCDKVKTSLQERGSEQYLRYAAKDRRDGKYPLSGKCFKFSDSKDANAIDNYLKNGMALTDYYCDNFFERIAQRSASRQFLRGGINDVGAAISAILGLASASAGLTGGIGAGFGLADSGVNNYNQAFLVHADLPALQKLVRSAQKDIRTALFDGDAANGSAPTTYPEAAIEIMRYANTCSFTGMRGLMSESMIEKARQGENPLDGSRIFDLKTLTPEQRKAVLSLLKAQDEVIGADEKAAKAEQAAKANQAAKASQNSVLKADES